MKKSFTETKWLLGLIGLLMFVLGLWLFIWPIASMMIATMIVGLALIISAIFYFVGFFFNFKAPYAGWMLVATVLNFLLGALFLMRPGLSLEIIIFIIGVWAIALGATHFASSFMLRSLKHSGWGWHLAGGLIGILIGLIIIFNPFAGFVATNWVIAFGFVFYGVANIIGAFYINEHTKDLQWLYKNFG